MKQIRGHHLFCMPLFSGSGYSEGFSKNMTEAIEALKGGELFQLRESNDLVCAACPNFKDGGGCVLGTEDVRARDRAAFRALGFQPGEECGWERALSRLRAIGPEDFQAVCGGCRWSKEGLCSYELLKERVK